MPDPSPPDSPFQPLPPQFEADLLAVLPHLRAFSRSLTRHSEEADDLASEAVLRAIRCASHFQPGTNFRAWIFTILRNLYYNEARKARIRFIFSQEGETDEATMPATQEIALEMVDFRRAFWRLGSQQREALILVGASGLSYEEAAAVCGCELGTIKSRVSRARAELKRLMEEEPGRPPLPAPSWSQWAAAASLQRVRH